ncbi:MAG: spore coat protein CotH [Verrucomicrobia bacterium]|nr:spore coat protein CotH [Verrucomicrobiota bacterium]
MAPADVKSYAGVSLYDAQTLRTLFLEFENADWEQELAAFNNTDVEVPARVTVDGGVYTGVGVHFRGASSYMMVGEGRKRSLNLSFDYVLPEQQLGGYRTLNLLNSHEDPSFLRTVLYFHIARTYLPAPQANFVHVVINGESWGVYVNVQQFNKEMIKEWFGTTQGARWKVPGSPGGRGGLNYLGDEVAPYRRLYEIKSKDEPKAWASLIRLCKVLEETPVNELERALSSLLDVDGVLRFLALENALINNDGYWVRASDYSIYQDPQGKFHILPYDANETFTLAGGPGFRGGPGGPRGGPGGDRGGPDQRGAGFGRGPRGEAAAGPGQETARGPNRAGPTELGAGAPAGGPPFDGPPFAGPGPGFGPGFGPGGPRGGGLELDPLVAVEDAGKPLLSKLLSVPALRARYLGYVRQIAETWLDWNRLGPLAEQYQRVIAAAVQTDTRKLDSNEAFVAGLAGAGSGEGGFGPGRRRISLKEFAEKRRAYLLDHPEIKKL